MGAIGSNRRIIGLVGIVIAVCFVYFTFAKDVPFTGGYEVKAVFKSSNQLRKGSPVRIAGVEVGKVSKMERGDGDTAEVTMEIKDSGRPIKTDATLKIRPRLFLEGGFFVELQPGSAGASELDDGGTIGLPQTAVPVQFHQVLTAFDRPARESIQALLRELDTALADGGAEALGRSAKPLAPTLRDVSIVAEAARGSRPGDVTDTITATSRVTAALARRDEELGQLAGNLNRTSSALARNEGALGAGVRELDGTLREAPDALRAIDRSLPPTEAFFADLRPSLEVAPGVLKLAPPFLRQVELISGKPELRAALNELDPVVNRLPQLTRRLRKLLPKVTPVTDCVGDKAVPILKSSVKDGELTTGKPVWQELNHLMVGLASFSQTFDGNGHAARYNLGLGAQTLSLGNSPLGPLTANAEQSISGARPLWLGPGRRPPFRPDVPCASQTQVDLTQRTGGGTGVAARAAGPPTTRKVTREGYQDLVGDLVKELKKR